MQLEIMTVTGDHPDTVICIPIIPNIRREDNFYFSFIKIR